MNREFKPDIPNELAALWDEHRDGTLSAEQQQQFDALLAEHDDARALWRAESQWLEALAESDFTDLPTNGQASDFAADVITAWQTDVAPQPVIGRIEPVSAWRWAANIAAAVILVAGVMILANQMNPTADSTDSFAKGRNGGNNNTVVDEPVSPLSQLVANTSATDLDVAHPSNIRRKVTEAVAVLDPGNLVDLLDPAMPDPAEYFEPL